MIRVKSNIDGFLKNYQKKIGNFKTSLNSLARKLAERMSADMKDIIVKETYTWSPDAEGNDETGKMAYHRGIDISFDITNIGDNGVRVSIGNNLQKHIMSDGTIVNPIYFIEFGFGVRGQQNPATNHSKFGWEYNINGRTKGGEPPSPWWYEGWDGEYHLSDGTKGTNFMYRTIDKYRNGWKQYLKELMTEIENG
jgi:hypothetical protein